MVLLSLITQIYGHPHHGSIVTHTMVLLWLTPRFYCDSHHGSIVTHTRFYCHSHHCSIVTHTRFYYHSHHCSIVIHTTVFLSLTPQFSHHDFYCHSNGDSLLLSEAILSLKPWQRHFSWLIVQRAHLVIQFSRALLERLFCLTQLPKSYPSTNCGRESCKGAYFPTYSWLMFPVQSFIKR